MPPRVSGAALPLAAMDASLPQASRWSARCPVHCFSTTARAQKISKARYDMYQWLKDAGPRLEGARGPVYLGKDHASQPFPANPMYRSQPVLSTAMREDIFARVMEKGESLKSVSAELGVDVRRVAAVIRLMQVQKDWEAQGKKLATPYAKAVMKMLPQTHPDEGEGAPPHEPINDIHVHNYTLQQLFVPVSESRTFTRKDAAKAFHETLSSVDVRSPQANLIVAERAVLAGKSAAEAKKEFEELNIREEDEYARKISEQQALLEKQTIRHRTDRCEFRFQTYNANDVGKAGRKADAVGWRYGAPLQDRKRGAVKIPTSVP